MKPQKLKYENALWIHLQKFIRTNISIFKEGGERKSPMSHLIFRRYQTFLAQFIFKRSMNPWTLPGLDFEFALPLWLSNVTHLNILKSIQNYSHTQSVNPPDTKKYQFKSIHQKQVANEADLFQNWLFFQQATQKNNNRNISLVTINPVFGLEKKLSTYEIRLHQLNNLVTKNTTFYLSNIIKHKIKNLYSGLKIYSSTFKWQNFETVSSPELTPGSTTLYLSMEKPAPTGNKSDNIEILKMGDSLFANSSSLFNNVILGKKTKSFFFIKNSIFYQYPKIKNRDNKRSEKLSNMFLEELHLNAQHKFSRLAPARPDFSGSIDGSNYNKDMENENLSHSAYKNRIFPDYDEPELVHQGKQKIQALPAGEPITALQARAPRPIQLASPVGIAAAPGVSQNSTPDVNQIAREVYTIIEKNLRTERERRGIFS